MADLQQQILPLSFKIFLDLAEISPVMAMGRIFFLVVLLALALCLNVSLASKKMKVYDKGWECKGTYCCNQTISEIFTVDNFKELFSKRNTPVAHAVGFWDYYSFINAAAQFEGIGFGTTGGQLMQQKELAAFLGNVAAETSFGNNVATGGPTAWGLCYKEEMSPDQLYCDQNFLYPCAPGASYHGCGALPIYWNFNYGPIGEALKLDLLTNPDIVSNNATIGFLTAMRRWMNPIKPKQPSTHDVFVGNWKPTKNDTESNRLPGFGIVINVLNGGLECGKEDIDAMNNMISHYLYFLDLLGVGREQAGDNLDCGQQVPLNPVSTSTTCR